ncbi:hypothetical protein B1F79_00300 [Coxiella-like endosymbiont of Rhipicephalus sanguineus]|uniref:hypothetical protein n=1 Tax=Coxiella-like endosymbiont of Rhipicephalus sanguineus TaxID=1955402 RepID=UPI00203B80A6|nr:hypothetical protein [Coxiella-like endosymbiont of Rhipicephalus sanguineus]MBT8506228.1 hypothetical protein [Coxiella-like endosymbiont of Rhipicephalus sanguineus]
MAQASASSLIPVKLKQSQFGFYTLLPKMEVTTLLPMSPTLFASRTVPLAHFILQIASFKISPTPNGSNHDLV